MCDSEATQVEELYVKARSLGACLTYLDDDANPGLPTDHRQALRQRCSDRSLAALDQAAALGFRDLLRLQTDDAFTSLRSHPGYAQLISRLSIQP